MATLHQAIETTRTTLKWGGILVGGIFLAITIYRGGVFLKDTFFPKPAPPPTVQFGKLPQIEFPKSTLSSNYIYSINTVTGSLPTFPDRVNIYQIAHDEPNLLDLSRARSTAARIGIEAPDVRVSETAYSWTDVKSFSRKLVMDIISRNFIYTTDFLSYQPLTKSQLIIDDEDAKKSARQFLSSASSLQEDINKKIKTSRYKIDGGELVVANNISETQIVRVDFFHEDIDKMPIYSTSPITSPINLLVSNYQNKVVVEANYYHHSITKVSSTYPIKTPQEALKELQDGKGYIASNFNPKSNKVPIRNVLLAYYLADKKVDYLMPIIVFTDNDGFYAYVPAVKDEWVK